jgi:hypothetical protein
MFIVIEQDHLTEPITANSPTVESYPRHRDLDWSEGR